MNIVVRLPSFCILESKSLSNKFGTQTHDILLEENMETIGTRMVVRKITIVYRRNDRGKVRKVE